MINKLIQISIQQDRLKTKVKIKQRRLFYWVIGIGYNNIIEQLLKQIMQRSYKKSAKKNLFSDDEDEGEGNLNMETTDNNLKQKYYQRYDAAKIEENEMYIKREVKEQQLKNQVKKSTAKKKLHSVKKEKKKNLFDSDSDSEKSEKNKQEEQEIIQKDNFSDQSQEQYKTKLESQSKQPQEPVVVVSAKEMQGQNQVQNFSDQEQEQDDNQNDQLGDKIKQIAEKENKNEDEPFKEVSFSKLVEKTGTDRNQLKSLIYNPIPKGFRAICIFKRVPNGFSESYQLILQDSERSLFFSENQRGCIGANYYISLTKEMDKNSTAYVGKLRGNRIGSIYQLYDGGKQPQKNINRKEWRCSMGKVQYETNLLGMNGPRKLKAVIPNIEYIKQMDIFKLAESQDLSIFQPPNVIKFRNKQPKWNQRLKSYALNFGGKVKQASIKNFILVNDEVSSEQEYNASNLLIFGKIDDNNFSLEAVYPLSIFQAFGIVLSQFDFKLNCQ